MACQESVVARHNKKRNTGLLYEFLARHIAESLVECDEVAARKGIKLLRKHFKRGTELHREFRLFNAMVNATVAERVTARRIVEEARAAAKTYDAKVLDREKSLLIRGINHTFNDPKFYAKHVDEYRTYATVQTLLDDWRRGTSSDIVKMTGYEEDLVEWLVTPKDKNVLEEQGNGDVDNLLLNLMFKKVDSKYKNTLNPEQIKLVNGYVYSLKSGDDTALRETIEELKRTTLVAIDGYADEEGSNARVIKQLNEIKAVLEQDDGTVNDAILSRFLRVAQLKHEILGG